MFSRLIPHVLQSSKNIKSTRYISTIGVCGLGSMGHGVVQLCAEAGYEVVGIENNSASLLDGMQSVEKGVRAAAGRKVKKGLMTEEEADKEAGEILHRVSGSIDMGELKKCDLVIEAIIEDLDIKKKFFAELAQATSPDCILATNTSSYPVKEMAKACGRPNKMVGLHYFNPVQVMKLVEVISLPETEQSVTDAVLEFVKRTGKTAVECGDTPGFIVNRLLVPYIVQGVALVARGDATPEAVDTAMRLGAGHPMGPITLSDYVGNDINLAVMKGWQEAYPNDPAFQVPEAMEVLEKMCAEGKLGRKTGQGFYKWEGNKVVG
eukprot:g1901.t1